MGNPLSLSRISALADMGGYEIVTHLSSASAIVALSICDMLLCSREWANGYEFSDEQLDDIDSKVSQLVYELMTPAMTQQLGTIIPHVLADFPVWLLPCDGAEYLRADYPDLYAVLDSEFVVDADHFVTPDLSERFLRGENVDDIGGVGGLALVTLETSQIPSHDHSYSLPTTGTVVNGELVPDIFVAHNPAVGGNSTGNAGGGGAHENQPPYLVVRFGIVCFAGVGLATFPSVPQPPIQVYDENVWLDVLATHRIQAMTYYTDSLQYNNQGYYSTSPSNDVDILEFSRVLSAGDYELGIVGQHSTSLGKFRWWIDGVELASDIDQYASAVVRNYVDIKTATLATSGLHTFLLHCVGKNAASSNYNFVGTGIWLRKV